MRRLSFLLAAALLTPAGAPALLPGCAGPVSATIDDQGVTLDNELVSRAWERDRLVTTAIEDARSGLKAGEASDFSLEIDGAAVPSAAMPVASVDAAPVSEGCRLTWRLLVPGVADVTRTVDLYEGTAGFIARTTIAPTAPAVLTGYTLENVALLGGLATLHAFRAGADWRFDEGWDPGGIGDDHRGDWRVQTSGVSIDGPGEWLSIADAGGRSVGIVMERRDYASSRMEYDFADGSAVVDLSRDIVYFGPLEENVHTENPGPGPGRRTLVPHRPLVLEPVYTVLGTDADDEPWQFYRLLTRHRLAPYRKAVTFNTNRVDDRVLSEGAKDDVNFERFQTLAEAAHEMGVETFVLDDGWQARSGDWCPDSPACPEPRWDGSADSPFRPRFPDERFEAVRALLADDPRTAADEPDIALGLWMTPMEFHYSSAAYRTSPSWTCAPVGHATAALSVADPDGGSNDAGIGVWNPAAYGLDPDTLAPARLDAYIEGRIARAIETYGARYFKFDFLAWIDCAGAEPVDMYSYHDTFVAMLDRLQARYPEVTFQIDETNDYRMFPFESVARGPSWFQNGAPETARLLHNLWNLAPYVPGFSIGQQVLGNAGERASRGFDYLMAASLGSHITLWTEIDELVDDERARVRRWTDFYKANREELAAFTYPLLDDPLEGGWTALQPWNPGAGRGFLLAFNQGAPDADRSVPLRGIRGDGSFTVTRVDPGAGTETAVGTFTAEVLRTTGVPVSIPDPYGYAILRVVPST